VTSLPGAGLGFVAATASDDGGAASRGAFLASLLSRASSFTDVWRSLIWLWSWVSVFWRFWMAAPMSGLGMSSLYIQPANATRTTTGRIYRRRCTIAIL